MKNILLRTNLLVCVVVIVGFAVTSAISYCSNRAIFRKDVQDVSALASEGMHYRMESIFTRPLHVSLTMANDNLLKSFLAAEDGHLNEGSYIQVLRDYLSAYRKQYGYDSVFLISSRTGRYYHFNGLDRILTPENPENKWYYAFLKSSVNHSLNIDNDEARDNAITVFINCRITRENGDTMGVVGVGFRVDTLQKLLKSYADQFNVRACLMDDEGGVVVSTEQAGRRKSNLLDARVFPEVKERILKKRETTLAFWHASAEGEDYIVSRYLPNLKWHLIVENDVVALTGELNRQLYGNLLVIMVILASLLAAITTVLRKYNSRIVNLAIAMQQKHRSVFQEATEQMYENIYELDVTHNRAASEATARYFESLGAAPDAPYDESLKTIAATQVREEFRQGYLETFSRDNVLKAYGDGINTLRYDFMISSDGGENYYWMRITARIFYWEEDDSVRMFVYRQNIDSEKCHERRLVERMQKDSLTGLYNKAATQERVRKGLAQAPEACFAFFILDVDKFKAVNDTLGHVAGDAVLIEFARVLKNRFREEDVVGRIGGDEFVAFVRVPDAVAAAKKARSLVGVLHRDVVTDAGTCTISTSIGVAVAPEAGREFETLYKNADAALYLTKKRGRNGFTMYSSEG